MAFRSAQSTHCSVLKPGIFPYIGNKRYAFYFLSFCQSFHWGFPPKSSKIFLHLPKKKKDLCTWSQSRTTEIAILT